VKDNREHRKRKGREPGKQPDHAILKFVQKKHNLAGISTEIGAVGNNNTTQTRD
jgi:hypothetical protein